MLQEIEESVEFIKERIELNPITAIVLGTGLSKLVNRIEIKKEISYKLIPHFVPTTVESHPGKLIFASWKGIDLIILSGRLHYYEGYSLQEVTYPIRVLKHLGIKNILLTNASGTVNPDLKAGDLVFIEDHINFHPENPLRGINDSRLGLRFPDMTDVYDSHLLSSAKKICQSKNIEFNSGIYFGLQGPSLETKAEYRMIRMLGADIVGMSTVPEAIVAHQSGLKILAASIVSNNTPDTGQNEKTTIESVISTIETSSEKLFEVFEELIQAIK
ncbi:MAG: purine-nucleoside phosphorylase [Saprospiraceae bacterium]|nr:purine-nucleoside phosphorylase [Saprospiraceae bacterium]